MFSPPPSPLFPSIVAGGGKGTSSVPRSPLSQSPERQTTEQNEEGDRTDYFWDQRTTTTTQTYRPYYPLLSLLPPSPSSSPIILAITTITIIGTFRDSETGEERVGTVDEQTDF